MPGGCPTACVYRFGGGRRRPDNMVAVFSVRCSVFRVFSFVSSLSSRRAAAVYLPAMPATSVVEESHHSFPLHSLRCSLSSELGARKRIPTRVPCR